MNRGTAETILVVISALCSFGTASALELRAEGQDLVGAVNQYRISQGESLIEIARAFGLGYNEITGANPGEDPFAPRAGRVIRLPLSWVLPDAPRERGIVINLSELRLYYFSSGEAESVFTFPIGIGAEGSETPVGSFTVTEKRTDPTWVAPASIRREQPNLPNSVPPGPDNPLGSHALRLSNGSLLIHGTNKPWGVGRLASHGCIRLYPEDIPKLYALADLGARVTIVRQPVKVGLRDGKVYMEVHGGESIDYNRHALGLIMRRKLLHRIDGAKFFRALREKTGIPEDISM